MGDPLYHLRALDLTIYRGFADVVYVFYGINEIQRKVFINKIMVNSQSPLGGLGYTFP